MKLYKVLFMVLALGSAARGQDYRIEEMMIVPGGGSSSSSGFSLDLTAGQPIVGSASSASYILEVGFWVGGPQGSPGCTYVIGDINANGATNGIDVVYGVNYFKGGSAPPISCDCPPNGALFAAGDVNGNCQFNGIDVSYFVNYLKGGAMLRPCASCPPAGMAMPPPAPALDPVVRPIAAPMLKRIEKSESKQ